MQKIRKIFSLKHLGLFLALVFLIIFQYVWISFKLISENEQVERLLWKREYERYEQAIALLDGVQISLNDAFKSKDIEFEKNRYERYKIEYSDYQNKLFDELSVIYNEQKYFSESVLRIDEFNEAYFTAAENQFYFLNKNKEYEAFVEYSKATSLHQSIRDNVLELKNQSEIQHNELLQRFAKIKEDKIQNLSLLTFALFIICLFIYYVFSKLIKQISSQSKELRLQMKELEILKFAVDNFLLISKADLQGNITYINKLFEQTSGYSFEELKGRNHRVIRSNEHDKLFFNKIWEDITGGKIWRGQIKNRTKNGEFYWVESCILPIKNADGIIEEYISIRSDITKQKDLESSLLEKNIFYQSLVSNMSEGLVAQGVNGNIVLCNERAATILERPIDVLLNKNSIDPDWRAIRLDGSDYPAHEHPSMIVLKGEAVHAHGIMGLMFKERIKWIEINSVPIKSDEKKILYSLTTFFDVTQKTNQMRINLAVIQLKEAFFRYQHSLKEFYNFINFSIHNVFKADLIFVLKLERNSSNYRVYPRNSLFEFFEDDNYVNYEILLTQQLLIPSNSLDEMATTSDQSDLKVLKYDQYREYFSFIENFDQKIEDFSVIVLRKNDLPHTVIFLGFNSGNVKVDLSNNRLIYLQALDQMISNALDEEYLREEKEKLQFTLESSGVYFISINLKIKKVKVDESFKKKFELSYINEDIDIEDFFNTFHKRDSGRSEFKNLLNDIFSKVESFERRIYLKRIDLPDEVYVLKGKLNQGNEKNNYYCTLIDESKNASLEDEIQKQKDIVYQNQKLAAIGELAAGVGHEINNPLTIISGYVQKLRRFHFSDLPEESANEYFKNMEKSIHRIKNIVSGLRKFSHKNSVDVEIVDLYICISDVVEMVRDIYLVDGISVVFNVKATEYLIVGNYGKIQQVVINLMNNGCDALKEISKEDKKIEVKISQLESKIYLEVIDNGPGIPDEAIDKIFNAFYTTKQVGDGTGLGLSIVHNIIKEHNAKIEVSSKLNEFTSFKIVFESHVKDKDKAEKYSLGFDKNKLSEIDSESDIRSTLFERKILVVEDESSIRDIIKDILEDYKVEIIEVENGLQALEQIAKHEFDLVLTDMKMPVMTGQELLERVKEFENIELSRFIIMSGGVNLVLENLKEEFGFSDIINKPFDDQDLVLKIYHALKSLNGKDK